MIILNVIYTCKPGKREDFLNAIKAEGLDEKCRAEEGNIRYSYFFAAENPDELFLLENWKDAEALALHGDMAHFKRIGELKNEFVDNTKIDKFITE